MSLIGMLIIIGLGMLVGWRFISGRRVVRRIKRNGILIEARVTEVKREERLVTQLGGASSTSQKLTYETFLYAQWHDPLTQENYAFRIKVPDFSQFRRGESIPIRMNRENPNEYRLDYSQPSNRPAPRAEDAYDDYQQGYSAVEEGVPDTFSQRAYETPDVAYPQQALPNQQQTQES